MSWKPDQRKTLARLHRLQAERMAITNLRERIELIISQEDGLRAQRLDGDHVSGSSGNHQEERLVNTISKLDDSYRTLKEKMFDVNEVERSLLSLTSVERQVITRLDINREARAVERLIDELGYSQASIYRIRRKAVENLTIMLFP